MIRLQTYILRRLAGSFVLVVLVVSSVIFIAQMLQFLDRTPDVGLGFLLAVLPLFLPVTLAITVPLAFLVALLLTYGRLADDNEVIACRMSGMHPWVLVSPAVFAGSVLTVLCLALHLEIAPGALAGQETLRQDAYGRFLQMMESGVRNSFVNRDFKISWSGVRDGALVDVHISKGGRDAIDAAVQYRREGQPVPRRNPEAEDDAAQEIHAATAILRRDALGTSLLFDMQDVTHVIHQGDRWTESRMSAWTLETPVSRLLDLRAGLPNRRALSYADLLFRVHRWGDRNETGRLAAVEAWSRIALGFAPFCFALCAVPLALLVGKGSRGTAAVLGLGVAIVFFALWEVGGVLAGKGSLPAAPASLGGNVALAITGLVLLRAVGRR